MFTIGVCFNGPTYCSLVSGLETSTREYTLYLEKESTLYTLYLYTPVLCRSPFTTQYTLVDKACAL